MVSVCSLFLLCCSMHSSMPSLPTIVFDFIFQQLHNTFRLWKISNSLCYFGLRVFGEVNWKRRMQTKNNDMKIRSWNSRWQIEHQDASFALIRNVSLRSLTNKRVHVRIRKRNRAKNVEHDEETKNHRKVENACEFHFLFRHCLCEWLMNVWHQQPQAEGDFASACARSRLRKWTRLMNCRLFICVKTPRRNRDQRSLNFGVMKWINSNVKLSFHNFAVVFNVEK